LRPARPTGKSRDGCGYHGCRRTGGGRWQPTAGGRSALAAKGAGGAKCKLTVAQLAELEAALDAGPAAWGWDEDQCWTLARIADLVRRRFRIEYTPAGIDVLLHRIGWSVQVPVRRAGRGGRRRLEAGDLARHNRTVAAQGAWLVFEDESGQGLKQPKGRTWGGAAGPQWSR